MATREHDKKGQWKSRRIISFIERKLRPEQPKTDEDALCKVGDGNDWAREMAAECGAPHHLLKDAATFNEISALVPPNGAPGFYRMVLLGHGRGIDRYNPMQRDLEYVGVQAGEEPAKAASTLRELATLMPNASERILQLAADTEAGSGDGILEKGKLYRLVRMIPDRGTGRAFVEIEGYEQEFRANQFLETHEIPLYKRILHKDGIF